VCVREREREREKEKERERESERGRESNKTYLLLIVVYLSSMQEISLCLTHPLLWVTGARRRYSTRSH
jgi:hypothetical protein